MEEKKIIRQEIYKRRRQMDESYWKEATRSIAERVLEHPLFINASDIYCYVDYHRETGTRSIIEQAWSCGKRVWVPLVMGDKMEFFQIRSYDELSPGMKGILEPKGTGEKASGESGLMVMPGVAFDKEKHRIGYGGGYYDKYLAGHPKLRTMAVAFDCQIFEEVEHDPYDIQPEVLITETSIYG